MKNLKILVFSLVVALVSVNANAQDEENKWAVGFGLNVVDVSDSGLDDIGGQLTDYFNGDDWNAFSSLSRLTVARYLGKGVIVDGAMAINSISKSPFGAPDDESYFSLDFGARYDLNELVGETAWFDPYVKLSLGGAWIDSESVGFVIAPAAGFNTWFNDNIGLNLETSYKTSSLIGENTSNVAPLGYHFQHSVSLVFKFDK